MEFVHRAVLYLEQPRIYLMLAAFTILAWEHWLSRTKRIAANSTLELAGNGLVALGKLFIPGLAASVAEGEAIEKKIEQPPAVPPAALVIFALGLLSVGCAPSALELAQRSLTAADQVQTAGQVAFRQFDVQHQQAIVDAGHAERLDLLHIKARVDVYREQQAKVVAAFEALAAGSHLVKAGLDAVAKGALQVSEITGALGVLYAAGIELRDAAKAIGWVVPGLDKLLPDNAIVSPPPGAALIRRRDLVCARLAFARMAVA